MAKLVIFLQINAKIIIELLVNRTTGGTHKIEPHKMKPNGPFCATEPVVRAHPMFLEKYNKPLQCWGLIADLSNFNATFAPEN